jgi:hypothetical protein
LLDAGETPAVPVRRLSRQAKEVMMTDRMLSYLDYKSGE